MTPIVRTFRAPDAASALAAVKEAFGSEAVILSTRTVDGGLFRKPEVEVTAALTPARGAGPRAAAPGAEPLPSARPARPRPPAARPRDEGLEDEVRMLRRSVEEARAALAAVTLEARAGRDTQLGPDAARIYARLLRRGVEPELAEAFVRSAAAGGAADSATILDQVRNLVAERLVPCRAPWLHDGRQVVALVGPTGVGKTTTIAKLAARAVIEARRRIALLTLDTYRVGATEQLARYGEILGAPVLVARDRIELLRAADRVKDVDLVLVDTAGRSSAEDVARQANLVRAIPRAKLLLAVSAATGALQLANVADQYRALAPDRLVFTKLDEAAGPGAVLSAAVRIGRPVACVADGQRVPEDLHALSGPQLVELVVGKEAPA
jgi:flagellar biosynthesis protein FlhF